MARKDIEQIVSMRKSGAKLQEIGDKFNLTRERIRQIVQPYNIPWKKGHPKHFCLKCKKLISSYNKFFCNQRCSSLYSNPKQLTKTELHRFYARRWYKKMKNDPIFKRATKIRNDGGKVSLKDLRPSSSVK